MSGHEKRYRSEEIAPGTGASPGRARHLQAAWGVGHHAADEVWLGLVEDGHQVVELAHEVGGHVLPPLPFSCPGPLEPPGVDQGGP